MKKIWIFVILAAFLLSGCGSFRENNSTEPATQENITPSATEATQEPVSPEPEATETAASASMPMITVSLPVTSEEFNADDGAVVFRVVTQSMHLVMPDPDVADRIIVDFLNRIDHAASTHIETLQDAQNAYTATHPWTPYLCSLSYAPTRIDQSVLSLYGKSVRYNGGAHAEFSSRAANYNVLTGDVLTLGSILVDASSKETLCELTIAQLDKVAEEKYLRDGYEDTVKTRFASEESYDEDWYFSTTGLCFYFDPYSIAPYASGVITAEIPYSDLIGVIDDAFFPPELDTSSGMIYTSSGEETDMTQFTRISEVILESEAAMHVIYTDHAVQDVRIYMNDPVQNETYSVFAAHTLGRNDAVVIQCDEEILSQLYVTFISNGEPIAMPMINE